MFVQDDRSNNPRLRPGAIRQLPPSLVNRIAAGEVIERPASVVKELLENSIDAGATHITVEVEDGGRELIRVIDDGSGISPQDLLLAFASHATSKLHDDEDLFRITTLGFRGEALASIGAVSHCRILSRLADAREDAAWEIHNRGGEISDPQAAAGNVGTTVEVRNLFYNVPARRKFLKGAATEFGHIAEMLLRCALPRPRISFRLLHNGRIALDLPATDEQQRLLCAWPQEFHEQRLPLDCRDAEIRLRGIIGLPELARPTARFQHIYLNNRPIRDKFIQHALREAYRGLTEPGRYPAAVLLIDMPPEDVDVNVHPTKAEVRFRDGQRIHGLVMAAVRERLLGSDLTPRAVARAAAPDDQERKDMQTRLAEFFRAAPVNPSVWVPQPAGASTSPSIFPPHPSHPPSDAPSAASLPQPPATVARGMESSAPIAPPSRAAAAPAKPPSAIQLHNSYLVAESEDGLIIIDQHALHERIMFEELKTRITRGPLESQRLLVPQTLAASTRQIALLEQIQPLLARLGIEAEPFGPDAVAVHAFPSFLERLDPAEFVRELLERGEQELLDLHEEELLHEILDMMACKAAVKAGDPLTPAEIEALLARKDLVERSSNCPHGRPTTLRLTLRDLEKQFKRTGF
ncbi:DNA mismatch repair endonuclease MutL [Fontivita pretiosa]|uniref:DNA mismatch repair endonuclease MutL n=1 Tax=Fontivita pretiosa TaxID=2989684 RepID=UPI003D185A73